MSSKHKRVHVRRNSNAHQILKYAALGTGILVISLIAPQGGATGQALEQSKSDLKVAETTVASLQAQIDKARYALKVDQANLDYTRIQAPISGLIISPTSAVYGNAWSKLDIAHQGQILNNKLEADTRHYRTEIIFIC